MERKIPGLSIVVPALNEEMNLQSLVAELEATAAKSMIDVEVNVVDDGSSDRTLDLLTSLETRVVGLRILHHDRSMGQSAAMCAGIHAAQAPYVATLDAHLQNDPVDLVQMLDIVRQGRADMVQGDRSVNRGDSAARRFSSWIGRTTRRVILGDTIRDTGRSARVMRLEIARQFPLQFRGIHRFLPLYARMMGATVVEVPVNHRPRHAGVSKYGMLNRGMSGLIDCLALGWMRSRLRCIDYRSIHHDDVQSAFEYGSDNRPETKAGPAE